MARVTQALRVVTFPILYPFKGLGLKMTVIIYCSVLSAFVHLIVNS